MAEHELQGPAKRKDFWNQFPWWFVAAVVLLGVFSYIIVTKPDYGNTSRFISRGLTTTLLITFTSVIPALIIGLLIGHACRSKYVLPRNVAFFYLATVGGIPTLVMIPFTLLLMANFSNRVGVNFREIPNVAWGITALILVYGAVYGDVFRLGFTKIPNDEGNKPAKPLGSITLIAAGITFIYLLRDSTLLSTLGVQEIFQLAKLRNAATFRPTEVYLTTIFLYLAFTIPIRLLLWLYEQRSGLLGINSIHYSNSDSSDRF